MRVHRSIRLLGATGKIRVAKFRGAEHVVVPVIALVEGVVEPVNVGEAELVLASEFGIAPGGWNGRPILPDHPQINGEYVLANDPEILESMSFGSLFNTRIMNDVELHTEAWLDPARAEAVGPEAMDVINRARDGKPIEVSTGFTALLEKSAGVYNGKRYKTISRNITPDHLAMLPQGTIGACSNKMGCGANVNHRGKVYLVTNVGLAEVTEVQEDGTVAVETKPEEQTKTLKDFFWDLVTFKGLKGTAAGVSDNDLRSKLTKALRAEEPAFMGVEQVFPEDGQVIFSSMPGEKWLMSRRSYSLKTDGTIKLADDKEEVVPVTNFVAASAAEEKQPCGCATINNNKEKTMEKALRIKALIDGSKGRFTEADKPWLEAIPEDRLTVLEAAPEKKEEPVAQPVVQAAAPKQDEPKAPQTVDEFVAGAPPEVREVLQAGLKANKDRRDAVIKALKDTKRNTFSDEALGKFSIEELESLRTLAAVPEVSHEGIIVTNREKPATGVDAPPRLADRLAKN